MPNDASSPTSNRQGSSDKSAIADLSGEHHEPSSLPNDAAADLTAGKPQTTVASPIISLQSDLHRDYRPPLPPRPTNLSLIQENVQGAGIAGGKSDQSPRSNLLSRATTAISKTDIQTQSYQDGSRETFAASAESTPPQKSSQAFGSIRRLKGLGSSDAGDTASIRSLAPTLGRGGDNESLLGGVFGASQDVPTWKLFGGQEGAMEQAELDLSEDEEMDRNFYKEFDAIPDVDGEGQEEGSAACLHVAPLVAKKISEKLLHQWKSKQKHFLILSSAGKPIYSRHGDDQLISSSIGIIQTIISFYEGSGDHLKGFSAAGTRFTIMSQGPLYLVAISKLGENDPQLRAQLEALYMQILSTLTLPTLNHLFANRPSTDLRRPLKGTEVLLSALADSFTRGSPPALLSALECLRMKKSQRQVINDTLLRTRCESLLYGLIVAGGRLVSVARPRKHSLHPSDLQLIFNMLFEAGGIKAGGGENWIPVCLPGFNKNGYLYMYVSFMTASDDDNAAIENVDDISITQDTVAVLLISANKESFYELRKMRDAIVEELEENGSMNTIRSAISQGRPAATDIVPGTVIRHFLYKSKSNVQFEPHFTTMLDRRKFVRTIQTMKLKALNTY